MGKSTRVVFQMFEILMSTAYSLESKSMSLQTADTLQCKSYDTDAKIRFDDQELCRDDIIFFFFFLFRHFLFFPNLAVVEFVSKLCLVYINVFYS